MAPEQERISHNSKKKLRGLPMKTPVAGWSLACALILSLTLTGCGGGGSDDDGGGGGPPPPPPPPTTAQGVFKDANVIGLSYTSGGQTGVTNASGVFTYELGQQITFRVGGVSLGSTAGKALITPLDLVPGSTADSVAVLNRVRFLMMLDDDSNPFVNGITILESVRTRAQQWTQVDFATADLAAALATIIADVQSATGATHTLPAADIARAQLVVNVRCAFGGAFRGTFTGDDSGRFGFVTFQPNGNVLGIGYSPGDQTGFTTGGLSTPIAADQTRSFIAGTTSSGASFSGSFTSPDAVSGTWRNGATDDGTFTGTRIGGLANAVYRFTGGYVENGGGDAGLFTFDINATDQVTGTAYSIPGDELITLTGNVNGTALSGTTSTGMAFAATLIKATGQLSGGTYVGPDGSGIFSGSGCKLN
jgi:hypothetical protein